MDTELWRKAKSLIREKGLFQGTITSMQRLMRLIWCTLNIPIQDNFLYTVPMGKWEKALDTQFDIFSKHEQYPFYKIKDNKDISEVRSILLAEAQSFLDTYQKLGYPFRALFKELVAKKARVLQLAVGACPELIQMTEELELDYYVEDPLFPKILQSVDLRKVFSKDIKGFCALTAEDMWPEYPEFFDAIVCHNVLNHTHAPKKVIDSMFRMLKPGGLIFDFTMRQGTGDSHPGMIGQSALLRGYTSRGFAVIYSAVFKHLDYPSFPQKHRYYTAVRKKFSG